MAECGCDRCFYCDTPLSSRHEHDHFPVPEELGGAETVPACVNCHDLKDRVLLRDWPIGAVAAGVKALTEAPPPRGPGRVLWAKWLRTIQLRAARGLEAA
jgi:hypothetical protein